MLVAFKNIIQQSIKLFGALKVFADMRHRGAYIRGKYAVFGFFLCFFSIFVISDNFTTEQCHSEGSDGVSNSTEHI